MTAPFVASLCGFRLNGNPNTSDNNDPQSIELGRELFNMLGVRHDAEDVRNVGAVMEASAVSHIGSLRPDLVTGSSRRALEFDQYQHLAVFREFKKAYGGPTESLEDELEYVLTSPLESHLRSLIERALAAEKRSRTDHDLVVGMVDTMPEESLLKIDITVGDRTNPSVLHVALSSKWTLRTDRAQDCVSQGAKLVSLRRGRMPHYAVLTMEPRPAMLKLLAYSSGAVDCVYHLALPELRAAAKEIDAGRGGRGWKPYRDLERMIAQRRIRDYEDLITQILAIPGGPSPSKIES
jgi:hypothetical protein